MLPQNLLTVCLFCLLDHCELLFMRLCREECVPTWETHPPKPVRAISAFPHPSQQPNCCSLSHYVPQADHQISAHTFRHPTSSAPWPSPRSSTASASATRARRSRPY